MNGQNQESAEKDCQSGMMLFRKSDHFPAGHKALCNPVFLAVNPMQVISISWIFRFLAFSPFIIFSEAVFRPPVNRHMRQPVGQIRAQIRMNQGEITADQKLKKLDSARTVR